MRLTIHVAVLSSCITLLLFSRVHLQLTSVVPKEGQGSQIEDVELWDMNVANYLLNQIFEYLFFLFFPSLIYNCISFIRTDVVAVLKDKNLKYYFVSCLVMSLLIYILCMYLPIHVHIQYKYNGPTIPSHHISYSAGCCSLCLPLAPCLWGYETGMAPVFAD